MTDTTRAFASRTLFANVFLLTENIFSKIDAVSLSAVESITNTLNFLFTARSLKVFVRCLSQAVAASKAPASYSFKSSIEGQ